MSRQLSQVADIVEEVPTERVGADLVGWLVEETASLGQSYLLAHADDGVIWGRIGPLGLLTSYDAARGDAEAESIAPPFRLATLQTVRVFADSGELLAWRDGASWKARLVRATLPGEDASLIEAFDERQMLWGTMARPLNQGFALLEHGSQGIRQVVPITVAARSYALPPVRLRLRHYLRPDAVGLLRVSLSRLVDLELEDVP